jgi:hypothetical protein
MMLTSTIRELYAELASNGSLHTHLHMRVVNKDFQE